MDYIEEITNYIKLITNINLYPLVKNICGSVLSVKIPKNIMKTHDYGLVSRAEVYTTKGEIEISISKVSDDYKTEFFKYLDDNTFEHSYIKYYDEYYERIEFREKGVIFTKGEKDYIYCDTISAKKKIADIFEKRGIFTYEDLKKAPSLSLNIGNVDERIRFMRELSTKIRKYNLKPQKEINLEITSASSLFHDPDKSPCKIKVDDQIYSPYYDIVIGENAIERIYELYYGMLTDINKLDVNAILQGLVNIKSFDLHRELYGAIEDSIVGPSTQKYNEEYQQYIQEFFKYYLSVNLNEPIDKDTIKKTLVNSLK